LKELGIDVVAGSSRGYSAPKGMPAEARKEFLEAMDRVIKNPAFQHDAKERAFVIDYKRGDDYAKFLKSQEKAFVDIWKEMKSKSAAK